MCGIISAVSSAHMIQKCTQRLDESGDLPKRKTADKSETHSLLHIILVTLQKKRCLCMMKCPSKMLQNLEYVEIDQGIH